MENTNLSSLPPKMHHRILENVCGHNIRDFGAARIDFPGFNKVGREDHLYRSADLLFMNTWYENRTVVDTFRHRCYELGNPDTKYMKGMYELFRLHLIDEGMDKIRDACDRGLELAKYVNAMLRLVLSADERGKVKNYHVLSRDFVARMAKMVLKLETTSGAWDEIPHIFGEAANRIDLRCVHTRQMCDSYYWQLEAWRFCDYIHLTPH